MAQSIREAVRAATGLTCSIGVAPNKLLAKMASELDKPDGLTLLRMEDVPRRIWPLPPRKINGIGPKSSSRLEALGIQTIGELAAADPAWLIEQFGRAHGAWMHDAAHGRDERIVLTELEPKSISRETLTSSCFAILATSRILYSAKYSGDSPVIAIFCLCWR